MIKISLEKLTNRIKQVHSTHSLSLIVITLYFTKTNSEQYSNTGLILFSWNNMLHVQIYSRAELPLHSL